MDKMENDGQNEGLKHQLERAIVRFLLIEYAAKFLIDPESNYLNLSEKTIRERITASEQYRNASAGRQQYMLSQIRNILLQLRNMGLLDFVEADAENRAQDMLLKVTHTQALELYLYLRLLLTK